MKPVQVIETVTTDEGVYQLEVTEINPLPFIKNLLVAIFWTYTFRHFYIIWMAARFYNWDVNEVFKKFPAN